MINICAQLYSWNYLILFHDECFYFHCWNIPTIIVSQYAFSVLINFAGLSNIERDLEGACKYLNRAYPP